MLVGCTCLARGFTRLQHVDPLERGHFTLLFIPGYGDFNDILSIRYSPTLHSVLDGGRSPTPELSMHPVRKIDQV
jgi:hypothetical protein